MCISDNLGLNFLSFVLFKNKNDFQLVEVNEDHILDIPSTYIKHNWSASPPIKVRGTNFQKIK